MQQDMLCTEYTGFNPSSNEMSSHSPQQIPLVILSAFSAQTLADCVHKTQWNIQTMKNQVKHDVTTHENDA